MSNAPHGVHVFGSNYDTKANAHVVSEKHLLVRYSSMILNQAKDGVRFRKPIDNIDDIGGSTGEVQEATACDV